MKRCYTCRKMKEHGEFYKNRCHTDGLQSSCKVCDKKRNTANYHKDREGNIERVAKRKAALREISQRFVFGYLLAHPCVDCGEDDPLILEFDHVRGEKKAGVIELVSDGYPVNKVKHEIEKCEIRCPNCHRRATVMRSGTWRLRLLHEQTRN